MEFAPDSDMIKEETAVRDPHRFYEHNMCALLVTAHHRRYGC